GCSGPLRRRAPDPTGASAVVWRWCNRGPPRPPSGVPCEPAPSRPKAGTTAPAGSTSILRSPPVMSFTFFAKSSAYSWKMSFCGHVDCHRIVIGPCAFRTAGTPNVAAPAATAAPVRNVRRDPSMRSTSVLVGVEVHQKSVIYGAIVPEAPQQDYDF